MPHTAFEFQYDCAGNMPAQVYIPHVAMRVTHPSTDLSFDAPMLLDTGGISDYTIGTGSSQAVATRLGDGFSWHGSSISCGPISSLQVAPTYSHHTLAHHPIAHPHRMKAALSTMHKGLRDANTMSLAYYRSVGCCVLLDPGLGAQATISEYFDAHNDGPVPFYTTDVGLPGSLPTLQHTVTARAARSLYINTAIRGPNGSVIQDFCWDTGAWQCNVPANYMAALGIIGNVVPKISVQTSSGNIVSFLNVPVDTDYDEILIGAPIFSRIRAAIHPAERGRMSFKVLTNATAINPITLPFEHWPWPPRQWA